MTKKPTDEPWIWNQSDDNKQDRRGHNPFGNDPFFDDPFVHLDKMMHEFNQMFEDLTNDRFSVLNPSFPDEKIQQYKNNDIPHLSQINPNVSVPQDDNQNGRQSQQNSSNNFFRRFLNMSDINERPQLSDINPAVPNDNNNSISNLPTWNDEKAMMDFNDENTSRPKMFYQSQSVIIQRDSNGNVKKTTTIRDKNGQIHSTTEEYNDDTENKNLLDHGFHPFDRMFTFNLPYSHHENDGETRKFPSRNDIVLNNEDTKTNDQFRFLETPNDPLKRIRPFIQKWNPFNWKKYKENDINSNNNNNDNNNYYGIRWRSNYADYRKKPTDIRNDIIFKKPDDKNSDN